MAQETNSPGFASGSSSSAPGFKDNLSADANTRSAELARKLAESADQARSSAAAGLGTAAGAVEDGAHEGVKRAKRAAQATAKALSSGADYIRENSARDMMDDAMDVVKNNPGVALLGAAALGFLVGRAFVSRN
jgi:ElaB/YqjD/DUF883 family membrane-anchored ribosome-binding protein